MGRAAYAMVNPKAAAKREQQAIRAAAKEIVAERRAEDAYWAAAGDGAQTKAQAKKSADEARKAEVRAHGLESFCRALVQRERGVRTC